MLSKAAVQKLHRAANDFTDLHGPSILDEFGLQLQCNYKYQVETMEHDPAAWTVKGRISHCKVVFEISLPGVAPVLSEPAHFNHIEDVNRGIPFSEGVDDAIAVS